jgi:hypothetical protein
MRMQIDFWGYAGQQGAVLASQFESGLTDRTQPEREALEQLRTGWEDTFQAFRNSLQRETEQHQKLNADAKQSLDSQKQEFSELIKKETNAWAALHKTYDEQLSLYKPVQYWTKKAGTHSNNSSSPSGYAEFAQLAP